MAEDIKEVSPEEYRALIHKQRLEYAKSDPMFANMRDEDFAILVHSEAMPDTPLLPYLASLGYDVRATIDFYAKDPEKDEVPGYFDTVSEYMLNNERAHPEETGAVLNDVYSYQNASDYPRDVSYLEGSTRLLAEGLGRGWSDEAIAGLRTSGIPLLSAIPGVDPAIEALGMKERFDPKTGKNAQGMTREQYYQAVLEASNARRQQFEREHPGAASGAELSGNILSALPTAIAYPGAAASTLTGAVEGYLYGAGKQEGTTAEKTGAGLVNMPANALLGFLGGKAGEMVNPATISPDAAAASRYLRSKGITSQLPGQMTGDFALLSREAGIGKEKLLERLSKQGTEFTRALWDLTGTQAGKKLKDKLAVASVDNIIATKDALGKEFDNLASKASVDLTSGTLAQDLAKIYSDHADKFSIVNIDKNMKALVDEVGDALAKGKTALSGPEYMSTRSRLATAANAVEDGGTKREIWEMIDKLDKAADASLKPFKLDGAFAKTRKNYLNASVLADAANNYAVDVAETGMFTPAQILSTLTKTGRLYSKNASEIRKLAEQGVKGLREPKVTEAPAKNMISGLLPQTGLGGTSAAATYAVGHKLGMDPMQTAAVAALVGKGMDYMTALGKVMGDSVLMSPVARLYYTQMPKVGKYLEPGVNAGIQGYFRQPLQEASARTGVGPSIAPYLEYVAPGVFKPPAELIGTAGIPLPDESKRAK